MYFSLGSKEIKKNFLHLYSNNYNFREINEESAFSELKKGYVSILKPVMPIDISSVNELKPIIFTNNVTKCKKMSEGYNISRLNDLDQSDIIKKSTYDVTHDDMNQYHIAIKKIQDLSPDLHQIFTLAINIVFFMKSNEASGGSTSGLPGVIWINPKSHWTLENKVEFLLHELTHNLLFIDEVIHGLYSYDNMYQEKYWTTSAVLAKKRPLDKSFHSAVVATELLLFRKTFNFIPKNFLAHPPTKLLIERTLTSLESCLRSPLLKERGEMILNQCLIRLEENVI